jgi:hypothetical protein
LTKLSNLKSDREAHDATVCPGVPTLDQEYPAEIKQKLAESSQMKDRAEPGYSTNLLFWNTAKWEDQRGDKESKYNDEHIKGKVLEKPDL